MRSKIHLLERSDSDTLQLERGEYQRIDIEQFAQMGGEILIAPLQAIGRGFNILNAEKKAAFGAIFFLTRPMPHPHDMPAIAQEINRRTHDWVADPDFQTWQLEDSVYRTALELRKVTKRYWRDIESRKYYRQLHDEEDTDWPTTLPRINANPRRDLAATTAGRLIQAVGRLLRGDVPFHGYFVDAAWAPNRARQLLTGTTQEDTEYTSLLHQIIALLEEYTSDDVGNELYGLISQKLSHTRNLY